MLSHIPCPTKGNLYSNAVMLVATSKRNTASGPGEDLSAKCLDGRKDFIKSVFSLFVYALDPYIAKNHFVVQLGIHCLAFVLIPICGSKVLTN